MENKYLYEESWEQKEEGFGTLTITEVNPSEGQRTKDERHVKYDCSVEDLKVGLENLEKTRDKSYKDFELISKEKEDLIAEIKAKDYSFEITEEMEKILKLLENHNLILKLDAKHNDLKTATEVLEKDTIRITKREEVLKGL